MSGITDLQFAARAGSHMPHEFKTSQGALRLHPVNDASIVQQTAAGVLYIDPVGNAANDAYVPAADFIRVTRGRGDQHNTDVLKALKNETTPLLTSPTAS